MHRRTLLMMLLVLVTATCSVWAQAVPDLSGTWKQDNARCVPPRRGEVTLKISEHAPEMTVETTMRRGSEAPRHAVQRYSTDGKETVSTGADGDEFHTTIVVREGGLHFTIDEHEDGRIIHSTETWTQIDGGAAIQRIREGGKDGATQTLIYTLVQP
jgi:hypothetical protein